MPFNKLWERLEFWFKESTNIWSSDKLIGQRLKMSILSGCSMKYPSFPVSIRKSTRNIIWSEHYCMNETLIWLISCWYSAQFYINYSCFSASVNNEWIYSKKTLLEEKLKGLPYAMKTETEYIANVNIVLVVLSSFFACLLVSWVPLWELWASWCMDNREQKHEQKWKENEEITVNFM